MGAVRTLARVADPESHKSYHIPRDVIEPPEELLEEIFPDLDGWAAKHDDRDNAAGIDQSVMAKGTIRALIHFRKVFIQDSVFLRERWPHLSAIWSHPFFGLPAYQRYAEDLKRACATPEVINPALARIDPECRSYLDSQFATSQDRMTRMEHHITTETASKADMQVLLDRQNLTQSTLTRFVAMVGHGFVPRVPFNQAMPGEQEQGNDQLPSTAASRGTGQSGTSGADAGGEGTQDTSAGEDHESESGTSGQSPSG
jgi:hypothetical protein